MFCITAIFGKHWSTTSWLWARRKIIVERTVLLVWIVQSYRHAHDTFLRLHRWYQLIHQIILNLPFYVARRYRPLSSHWQINIIKTSSLLCDFHQRSSSCRSAWCARCPVIIAEERRPAGTIVWRYCCSAAQRPHRIGPTGRRGFIPFYVP